MSTRGLRIAVPRFGKLGLAVLVIGIAWLLGAASAVLPAWFVVSVIILPVVAGLLLIRPEYALVACIALVCNLIHPALVPRIPLFGGALAAADATLAMLALYAAWSLAARAGEPKSIPVAGGRLMFVSLALFGISFVTVVGVSLSLNGLNPAHVLGEARDLTFLAILPIAIVVLRQRVRQERFLIGMVVLGCLFSIGQVLQGVFNISVFGAAGMSALETLGYREYSTTRATTHGLSVIVFALLVMVGAYALGVVRRVLFISVAGLLFTGIVLTFGRTTYATVLLCAALVVFWLNARKLPELALVLVLVVTIGSALGMLVKPESVSAVYYRMTTIGEELDRGYSAQWRIWEFEAMLPHIKANPLLGIGLGADYKGVAGSSAREDLNRYVHNAYLYMGGKMGLPALTFFLLMMTAVFLMGRRLAKSDAEPWMRIVGAAGAATMIRFVFASFTEPHLMSDHGVANIAIAAALVYLAARRAVAPDEADALENVATVRSPAGARKANRNVTRGSQAPQAAAPWARHAGRELKPPRQSAAGDSRS